MPNTLNDVVAEVLAGRIEKYSQVVREYQNEIWRIASFALRDREATEDLVQQVFVAAYTRLETYDPSRDFGAWLRTIARNLVRNECRRTSREKNALKTYHAEVIRRIEDESFDERSAALRQALGNCRSDLGDDARNALDMRYTQSMGFTEIAEALAETVAGARQLLTRIRVSLRRCIEERMARS